MGHQLGPRGRDQGRVRWIRRETDAAGAGAQRGFATQPCRSWHACAAADDQHMTKIAFVRRPLTARQQLAQERIIRAPKCRRLVRSVSGICKPSYNQFAAVIGRCAQEQPALQSDERDRQVGRDCAAQAAPVSPWMPVGISSDSTCRVPINGDDRAFELTTDIALEPTPENGIDDQIRLRRRARRSTSPQRRPARRNPGKRSPRRRAVSPDRPASTVTAMP